MSLVGKVMVFKGGSFSGHKRDFVAMIYGVKNTRPVEFRAQIHASEAAAQEIHRPPSARGRPI